MVFTRVSQTYAKSYKTQKKLLDRCICRILCCQSFSSSLVSSLVFLPPYSPDLNPIEQVWRCLKRELSTAFFESKEEFLGLMEEAYRRLSSKASFATGWFEKFLPEKFNQFRQTL
jgi:transposase